MSAQIIEPKTAENDLAKSLASIRLFTIRNLALKKMSCCINYSDPAKPELKHFGSNSNEQCKAR